MSWTTKPSEESKTEIANISFEERKAKILEQMKLRKERDRSFLLCSITGNPKVGKTGIALDCRTPEEIEKKMKVYVLDLDDGAEATWDAGWDRTDDIVIFNPLEMQGDGSIDWNESFNNAHAFIEMVKEETNADKNTKAFILDGVDKAYEGSSDALREHLAKNQSKAGSIIKDTDSVSVTPLDWKIRNRIYNRLLDAFLSVNCDRFLITHMKPLYEGISVPVPVGEVPDWHKSTPARFNQMIHIKKMKAGTVTNYVAELQASKTNPDLVGKEWVVFTTNGQNKWNGIEELRTGKL